MPSATRSFSISRQPILNKNFEDFGTINEASPTKDNIFEYGSSSYGRCGKISDVYE